MATKEKKGKPERVGDIINRLWPTLEIGAEEALVFEQFARSMGFDPDNVTIKIQEFPDGITLTIRSVKGWVPSAS